MDTEAYVKALHWLARNVANRGGAYMERSSAVAMVAHLTDKSIHDVIADVNLTVVRMVAPAPERPRRSVAEVRREKRAAMHERLGLGKGKRRRGKR